MYTVWFSLYKSYIYIKKKQNFNMFITPGDIQTSMFFVRHYVWYKTIQYFKLRYTHLVDWYSEY